MGLDEVWWLVSPQNPLKPAAGMGLLADRLHRARLAAAHPRIRVLDLERSFGTRYTADTLIALRRRFPDIRFVWIAGADLMTQLPRWARWTEIFRQVPVAVFARPHYVLRAMTGKAATHFASHRVVSARGRALPDIPPPAWAFFPIKLNPASATAIRAATQSTDAGSQEDVGNTQS